MAEAIREKIFRLTHQEMPYACAVRVEELTERERPECLYIKATIFVEQESQKGILIGRQGAMLKRIGSAARRGSRAVLRDQDLSRPARRRAQELAEGRGGPAGVRLPPHVLSMAALPHAGRGGEPPAARREDRLVEFYTRDHGKVRGVAKSARRPRSRFGAALEPFTLGELVFFDTGRSGLVRVDHFDIVHSFVRVRENLDRLGRGAWMCECARPALRRSRPASGAVRAAGPQPARPGDGGRAGARGHLLRAAGGGSPRPPAAYGSVHRMRPGLPVRGRRPGSRGGRPRVRGLRGGPPGGAAVRSRGGDAGAAARAAMGGGPRAEAGPRAGGRAGDARSTASSRGSSAGSRASLRFIGQTRRGLAGVAEPPPASRRT